MTPPSIGIIGNGNMAMAIVQGLLKQDFDHKTLWVSGPNMAKLKEQKGQNQYLISTNNTEFLSTSSIIFLAVKPNKALEICEEMRTQIQNLRKENEHPLIVSLCAGIKTSSIEKQMQHPIRVIRAMPNTPALLQMGATGLFANSHTTSADKECVESLLSSIGITRWVEKEEDIDLITALSGSGPAYFYYFMEGLIEGATKLGLDEQTARALTIQTALGAALMANRGESLQSLREKVTSKGGTTQAGLENLSREHLFDILFNTLQSAQMRAKQLGS